MVKYNTTQLYPEYFLTRGVFHRDLFAHVLRWAHVIKRIKGRGANVLDLGCGNGNLCEVLYRNQKTKSLYLGVDYKASVITKCQERFKHLPWASFYQADLAQPLEPCKTYQLTEGWDVITCLEVIEHIGKANGANLLQNLKLHASEKTIILLSTPNHDPRVGAADNHMIEGEVGEYTYDELKTLIEAQGLEIVNCWGTFASIRDYKPIMSDQAKHVYELLSEYYDTDTLSLIFAPIYPRQSRNVIWELRLPRRTQP